MLEAYAGTVAEPACVIDEFVLIIEEPAKVWDLGRAHGVDVCALVARLRRLDTVQTVALVERLERERDERRAARDEAEAKVVAFPRRQSTTGWCLGGGGDLRAASSPVVEPTQNGGCRRRGDHAMTETTTTSAPAPSLGDWSDPLEDGVRGRVRAFIEAILEEELEAALGRGRYERTDEEPSYGRIWVMAV